MLERLVADEWVKPGEGAGPKTGVLLQAIQNAKEAEGDPMDEDRVAAAREKIATKEGREGAMANASVHAEYKKLQAESAAKRAVDAVAKAKKSDDTLEGF